MTTAPATHLHVGPAGSLVLCGFDDLTPEDEYERLTSVMDALSLPTGNLAQMRAAILALQGPATPATRPTCFYWGAGEGCDDYRFWIEPHPEGQFAPGMVCGSHIVDHTADHANLGTEWVIREWLGATPVYPDDGDWK
jgi:hypothetical protein